MVVGLLSKPLTDLVEHGLGHVLGHRHALVRVDLAGSWRALLRPGKINIEDSPVLTPNIVTDKSLRKKKRFLGRSELASRSISKNSSSELISTYFEKGERRKKAIPRLFENSCLRLL